MYYEKIITLLNLKTQNMMKKLLTMAFLAVALTANAQENTKKWYDNFKFSGYGMLQYQAEDKEGSEHNEFNLRLARFILDGKMGDFDWRAQIQGTNAKGPRSAGRPLC